MIFLTLFLRCSFPLVHLPFKRTKKKEPVSKNNLFNYMYEGRFNPDVETMRAVRVVAGADSLTAGSGAVGGSVSYQTKEPQDLIQNGKNVGGYGKIGYATKNQELLTAVGLAGAWDTVEFLLNYSQRNGSETKNHAMRKADQTRLGSWYVFNTDEVPIISSTSSSVYPNPLDYKRDSLLTKFYVYGSPNHRFGIHSLYQQQKSHMNTDSANVTTGSIDGSTTRRAHDRERLHNIGIEYRYKPKDNATIDQVTLDYTRSDVLGLADTWIYNRNFDSATACSDPSIPSWSSRCPSKIFTKLDLKNVQFNNREYRPTRTIADQASIQFSTKPIQTQYLGEHLFRLSSNYIEQNYRTEAIYLHRDGGNRNFYSFALPDARKNIFNISLSDEIYFNDRFKTTLGVRYDNYRYKPYFSGSSVNNKTEYETSIASCSNSYNTTLYCERYRKGEKLPDTHFTHLSYGAMFDLAVLPKKFDIRYKIGTGFLAPTVTQIYSQFEGLGARQVPNYQLKPEKSLNQELEFAYKPTPNISFTTGGYLIKYKDFIHSRFWRGNTNNCTSNLTCMQSMNLDTAQVHGIKLGVDADVSNALKLNGNLRLSANFHTAKDKATIDTDQDGKKTINTLAAVPRNWIFGADYISPNGDWELHGKVRLLERKKAKDTKTLETGENVTTRSGCAQYIIDYYGYCPSYLASTVREYTYHEYIDTYKHADRSKTVTLIDVYGSKKFGKNQNVILNAGVYNLTNVNYIPWETLRQFSNANANTMIDNQGYGFNRYTAPGRNYTLSLEYKF